MKIDIIIEEMEEKPQTLGTCQVSDILQKVRGIKLASHFLLSERTESNRAVQQNLQVWEKKGTSFVRWQKYLHC